MTTMTHDPLRSPLTMLSAQELTHEVVKECLKLRGWDLSTAPKEIREDVFATLSRHEELFTRGFACSTDPKQVALDIQNAEWDAPTD